MFIVTWALPFIGAYVSWPLDPLVNTIVPIYSVHRQLWAPCDIIDVALSFEDSLEDDTTGDDTVTRAHRQMLRKLEGLIKLLPQYQQDKFDAVEILPGYLCWFEFNWVQVPESVPLNEVYSVWYKKQVKKENSPECNGKFAALFQNIQIRSSSEAIAETVGSIMANHIGKGRYLNPHNFSKEICLEYNLGPQVSLLLKGTYGISF